MKGKAMARVAKVGIVKCGAPVHSVVFRKYILLLVSLFINAFGIVFITKAALGTSPISSVPYVLSLATPFSFGTYTFFLNILFILAEMALMGRSRVRAKRVELLLQLPVVLVFSASIDFSMFLMRDFAPQTYLEMLISLVAGCAILAAGIGWAVKADVTMNPGEYLVNVISKRFRHAFGSVKLCFDTTLMTLAILLSLLFMCTVAGIREGTIVSALLVGPMERLFAPMWSIFDGWLHPRA